MRESRKHERQTEETEPITRSTDSRSNCSIVFSSFEEAVTLAIGHLFFLLLFIYLEEKEVGDSEMSGQSALMANLADVVKEAKDEEIPMPKSNDFFESKTFRLLTLMLYMGGVSGMGLTLAVYYLFIWDSRMPPLPVFKHTHPIG
ncbi:uncharacterized protein Dyak_GE17601 [Drosophila yakuba]|nr:uncharacterized protein Dyak_GE17601 [Drosophila yakuba]